MAKHCQRCGELKVEEEFTKDVSRPDGLNKICRECNKEKSREWYQENRRRKIADSQEYKARHKGKSTNAQEERVRTEHTPHKMREPSRPPEMAWKMIQFSVREWHIIERQARAAGMEAQAYVRLLVMERIQTKK